MSSKPKVTTTDQESQLNEHPKMATIVEWIPKTALVAQEYYKGATHIWLPTKLANKPTPQAQKPAQQKIAPQYQTQTKWVPKAK